MKAETAVVPGPGGPVGTAWMAGLAADLRRVGRLAVTASTGGDDAAIARMRFLVRSPG